MSIPQEPKPAKLVVGLIMKNRELFDPLAVELSDSFGAVDIVSAWLPFDYTDYYTREMGGPLRRRLLAYKTLVAQDRLVACKHITNRIETDWAVDGRRRVNIDPGLLMLERFVLATGKNFAHRIYLGQGIYADLTLIFRGGGFQILPWTYPGYADAELQAFLMRARRKLQLDLRAAVGGAQGAPVDKNPKGTR